MIMSDAVAVTFRGEPATLRVMRNDGYCWGRIVAYDKQQFDVSVPDDEDVYDDCDEHALERFEECMHDEILVSPAVAWL
ncbi:hypothetical protein J7E62_24540 [Variovorax paradoxus]|nr:hypothetical protein [Variovorax paradoxus]